MRPIETAENSYAPAEGLGVAERVIAHHWHRRDVAPFRPQGVAPGVVAVAEVNRGRWIVRCPFCPSAQFAARTDRRFFCVECLNETVGRRWVRVAWPKEAEIPEIEAALLVRPERGFMAWRPGQGTADLRAENEAGFHHSWSTPATWVVGAVVAAADMNQEVRDNFNETVPARAVDALLAIQVFG